MIKGQMELVISKYQELYDILIPKDDLLRQIEELVDFSFVLEALSDRYSDTMGRGAENPIRMFKYLMLKDMHEISDRDLVKRTRTDMAFKFFLGLAPEETNLIHPTCLTKFRTLRLKDESFLDMLIQKTVGIAIENGIEMGNTMIVDATHTRSRYNNRSIEEVLLDRAKKLRREVYRIDESMKENFPKKLMNPVLEDVMAYCDQVAQVVEDNPKLCIRESVNKRLNYLREGLEDTEMALQEAGDSEARIGHKAKDSPFFGYKTHIGMAKNRIITAATITSGEKPDGSELIKLIEKTKETGMDVKEIIGDTAYSGIDNLAYGNKNGVAIISKLNPIISNGNRRHEDNFTYNKDADMMVCPAGHMAYRKARGRREKQKKNTRIMYYFDVEKCKQCPQREGCYKDGAKSKTYSVTIKSTQHQEQQAFQESEYFKTRYRERYMIEAKNSELKNQHGYDTATASGLFGMRIQGAISIFNVNVKRILTLKKEYESKCKE